MKATKVTYSKMFNLGSYEHEEISIEIEIEQGEKAQDVLELAKKFVNSQHALRLCGLNDLADNFKIKRNEND